MIKRSVVNENIRKVREYMRMRGIPLPPFADYTVEDWKNIEDDEVEIIENMLGWDVTDFGMGNFDEYGLVLFILRNGNVKKADLYPKTYCEKFFLLKAGQKIPSEYHWYRTEDIINRGTGVFEVTLYNAAKEDFEDHEALGRGVNGIYDTSDVEVVMDGKKIRVPAGGKLRVHPGQSITFTPGMYHQLEALPEYGDCLMFEVSAASDDSIDNRSHAAGKRYPGIEDDVEPEYLTSSDYAKYIKALHF